MEIAAEIFGGFPNGNSGELPGRIADEIHGGTSGEVLVEIPGGLMYKIFS